MRKITDSHIDTCILFNIAINMEHKIVVQFSYDNEALIVFINCTYRICRTLSMKEPTVLSNFVRGLISKITDKLHNKELNKHTYYITRFIFLKLVKLFKLPLLVRRELTVYSKGAYICKNIR